VLVSIEPRPYGNDMTPEEREALLSRVFVLEPRIVFYEEIPVQSVESVELMLSRMNDLASQWPTFVEVLDLSRVNRPSAAVRVVIRKWMSRLVPRMTHMAVIVANNIVIRAVARFVAYSMNVPQISFHETKEQALDAARRARG
jgi:hypothetical protein